MVATHLSKLRNHESLTFYCSTRYEFPGGFITRPNQCCNIFSCRSYTCNHSVLPFLIKKVLGSDLFNVNLDYIFSHSQSWLGFSPITEYGRLMLRIFLEKLESPKSHKMLESYHDHLCYKEASVLI